MTALIVFAWLVLALLAVIALTAVFSISIHASLALAHDALPALLVLAWIILVVAVIEGEWALAAGALVLCGYHLVVLVPRMRAEKAPRWARHAPTVELVVSNVYTENETPELLARTLVEARADVMIITEWNPTFAAAFEAAGGRDAFPHRLCDENDHSDYAVCVLSRLPLGAGSTMRHIGQLTLADASVRAGERTLHIIGLNPTAVVDPDGFDEWAKQIDTLIDALPSLDRPLALAGDLNSTQFRPEYKRLLDAGLTDAHDALGKGLTTSFKLSADGALAAPGSVVRLDHALLSEGVQALRTEDLEACGSDHLPFRLTLAVRQDDAPVNATPPSP